MAGLSNFAENLLLSWAFTTGSATRPTTWFVALHTSDPGEDGTSGEVTTAQDSAYTRKSITFGTPADGRSNSTAGVSWTVSATSPGFTVSHISIWTASSGGNCLMKGPLPVPRTLAANSVLTFASGDIAITLD